MENTKIIDVFIEISKNSHIKYEYDKTINALRCDRILHTPLKYNFNYGFIAVFTFEAIVKIIAIGFSTYISNSWNKYN
jgi:hypothetical protein